MDLRRTIRRSPTIERVIQPNSKRMKTNVVILLVCGALLFGSQASARIVTLLLTGTNQTATLVLQENEGAKLAGGYDFYRAEVSSDNTVGYAEIVKGEARMPLFGVWYNW